MSSCGERFRCIWEHFGYRRQCRKLVEESYELAESIVAFETGVGDRSLVLEEVSDVLVLANQVIETYGIKQDELFHMVNYKADRTIERISEQ